MSSSMCLFEFPIFQGFGDYVPLQRNNYMKKYPLYFAFTIAFMMIGLTILASSLNLLVLYLINLNSEERLRKRMHMKQKKKDELNKMLIGDVIMANNKQVVTFMDEQTPNITLAEEVSVCSCDNINQCYGGYVTKAKRQTRMYLSQLIDRRACLAVIRSNRHNDEDSGNLSVHKKRFTAMRRPVRIAHLYQHSDKSDYILKKYDRTEIALRRLAFEGDFIRFHKVERRNSM